VLLADSVIVVIFGLFVVGFLGFFVMCVVLLLRFVAFIIRTITGTSEEARLVATAAHRFSERDEVCPHARCGFVNRRGARFCARCGRPLAAPDDVDAYG
jgi:hypothetical protein